MLLPKIGGVQHLRSEILEISPQSPHLPIAMAPVDQTNGAHYPMDVLGDFISSERAALEIVVDGMHFVDVSPIQWPISLLPVSVKRRWRDGRYVSHKVRCVQLPELTPCAGMVPLVAIVHWLPDLVLHPDLTVVVVVGVVLWAVRAVATTSMAVH